MLHPVFSTLIRRPDLLAAHLAGYGALVHEELSEAGMQLVRRGVAWAVAGITTFVFVLFAGIALMVGFLHGEFHWMLVAVPGAMLAAAVGSFLYARSPVPSDRFAGLKAQFHADVDALKTAGDNA